MKLYYHPASTTCRPIMLLAAAENISLEFHFIDLFAGENQQPAFAAINPNQAVPFLVDDDFRIGESSAILKYLAQKYGSTTYPADLRARARVNERMDWFNTGLYRDFGYGLIYTQVISGYGYEDREMQRTSLARARERSKKWLKILDHNILALSAPFVCGENVTIADYFGASIITLGDIIRLDFAAYPNVMRWLSQMKQLPYWDKVNEAFYGQFVSAYKNATFEGL